MICQKCNDRGTIKKDIGHAGRVAVFECDCSIGKQLADDLEKADQKYEAQTMDVDEGTAQ